MLLNTLNTFTNEEASLLVSAWFYCSTIDIWPPSVNDLLQKILIRMKLKPWSPQQCATWWRACSADLLLVQPRLQSCKSHHHAWSKVQKCCKANARLYMMPFDLAQSVLGAVDVGEMVVYAAVHIARDSMERGAAIAISKAVDETVTCDCSLWGKIPHFHRWCPVSETDLNTLCSFSTCVCVCACLSAICLCNPWGL